MKIFQTLLGMMLILGMTVVNASDTAITLQDNEKCRTDLQYIDENHAVWEKWIPGEGTYIVNYDFISNETTVLSRIPEKRIVSMPQEWDIYATGNYACWLEYNIETKLSHVGFANTLTGKKGLCTTDESFIQSACVDGLGNVYWPDKSTDPKISGIYTFNIDNDEAPTRIFPFSLGAYPTKVISLNGNAVWFYPDATGKMNIYLYKSETGEVSNLTENETNSSSIPDLHDTGVYWMSNYKLVRHDIETGIKEVLWDINTENLLTLNFTYNPHSNFLVMQGMYLYTPETSPQRDYFFITYDPATKAINEFHPDSGGVWIGKNSCYEDMISFQCQEESPTYYTGIKIYHPKTGVVETVMSNKDRNCTFRGIPRMSNGRIGWVESTKTDSDYYSSVYSINLKK